MSDLGHHGEWLSLLDVSGPFLAEPVLKEALPQGLQGLDPAVKKEVRQAYDEWREALDFDEAEFSKLHGAWISFVLERVLGYQHAEFLVIAAKLGDGPIAIPLRRRTWGFSLFSTLPFPPTAKRQILFLGQNGTTRADIR